jgi:hypothetical protein
METNEVSRNRHGVEKASVFEPKEDKGGRVKVYGCSPGCLLVSLALSVFLTLAVNSCIHLV